MPRPGGLLKYNADEPYAKQIAKIEETLGPHDRMGYGILLGIMNPDATLGARFNTYWNGDKTFMYREHYRESYSFGLSTSAAPPAGYNVNNQLPDNTGHIIASKNVGRAIIRYIGVTSGATIKPVVYNAQFTNPDVTNNSNQFPLTAGFNDLHIACFTADPSGVAAHRPIMMAGEFKNMRFGFLNCNGATGGTNSTIAVTLANVPFNNEPGVVNPAIEGTTKMQITVWAFNNRKPIPVASLSNFMA